MPGGPSQVDTFDHKPLIENTPVNDRNWSTGSRYATQKWADEIAFGLNNTGRVEMGGDIFPKVAEKVDDESLFIQCTRILRACRGNSNVQFGPHSGCSPSLGSWLVYGLGAETDNLPGFAKSPRTGSG